MKQKTVNIITLGCRVNQYESCAIAEKLKLLGYSLNKDGDSDYYIVNTCAVTAESERKSRQIARRCASKGKTLVIGCASQIDPSFNNIENVIYVGGNRDKMAVCNFLNETQNALNAVTPMDGAPYEEMHLDGREDLFSECRAFIKIQDGCNGKCTYCIIPKCRGKVRSRSADEIFSEAVRLVECGYQEIILTGIEVSAYNITPLEELILRLSGINGLKRLRLGSLSPNIISERFLRAVKNSACFMPHIHLSLQSCCDKVLCAMQRPYRKSDIFERVSLIRQYIPSCMISSDIIVGFPGETEEDFLETLNALEALGVYHVHSFPYSERKGTPAATMPNSVPKNIRAERNSRLIASCLQIRSKILDGYVGKTVSVLIEKIIDGVAFGHTSDFLEAKVNNNQNAVGDIINVKICSHNGTVLCGNVDNGGI